VEFDKLFPRKNFKELDIVVCNNPKAIAYYQNEIFRLKNNANLPTGDGIEGHARGIKRQLIAWGKWN